MVQPDMKFLDPLQGTHIFARFDSDPLAETMKKYWDYEKNPGIRTKPGEPRLLVVAVDIEDCTTATTFDSYTEYTKYGSKQQYRIDCPLGVTIDHIKASMSTAFRYQYPHFEAKINKNDKKEEIETRHFWDGAYIANTPANEVIQRHRKYWEMQKKNPPDLELYIINLYPAVEPGIPAAPDTILDRQTDIGFHDRTRYGIRVARMRTNYIDLISMLKDLAKNNNLEDKVQKILNRKTGDKTTDGKDKTYNDLVEGRFKIKKVIYAQRKEKTGTAIYGKAFDFSHDTLKTLREEGEEAGRESYKESQKYNKGNIV
jgi:predicted acylesterase/phospholipase RssA